MLQNAYFLAKIGADTAENDQNFAKNLPNIGNYPTGPNVTQAKRLPEVDKNWTVRDLRARLIRNRATALFDLGSYA